jgi:DNA-binding protein WhiA
MTDVRDRDLAQAVRAELAAIVPPRACCRSAERDGLGAAARGRARSPVVARLAVRLADALDTSETLGAAESDFDWSSARSHCRVAWLRGRFLANGSLSLGARGAHLEFVVPVGEGSVLEARLAEAGFPATMRVRRRRDVVTWKRTDTILGFLRSCGAAAAVLEIESRLVERQMHGHLNRVLNAETANLQRSVASSVRQVALIEQLRSEGLLTDLSEVERAVVQGRMEAPEASFTDLAERTGISRARVQRVFERLASVAAGSGIANL